MQILRSTLRPGGDTILVAETIAPDQGRNVDMCRVMRAVRVPEGVTYLGARTKGVEILAAGMY